MIAPPGTSVRSTCLTAVGRPLLSTGALSCRSKRKVELQHHQWRMHQLVMMEAGRGGIANGIVQQPATHRRAVVGSPFRKRLARVAKKQNGQRMILHRTGTIVNGTIVNGTMMRRAHGKIIAGAHGTPAMRRARGKIAVAHGLPAKRILARQNVQMRTAIGSM